MNTSRLSINVGQSNGMHVIEAHGEIDLYTVPEFRNALQVAIDRNYRAIVVDLRDTSYIDSAGLGALLAAYKTLSRNSSCIYVVADPSNIGVRRVMEITRLDTLIPVRSSLEEIISEISVTKAA